MKFVLFYETPQASRVKQDPDVRQKNIKKSQDARKDEEKYGKVVMQGHLYATGKGIAIIEFSDAKQMANRMALNNPDVQYKAYPLVKGELFQEALKEHGK